MRGREGWGRGSQSQNRSNYPSWRFYSFACSAAFIREGEGVVLCAERTRFFAPQRRQHAASVSCGMLKWVQIVCTVRITEKDKKQLKSTNAVNIFNDKVPHALYGKSSPGSPPTETVYFASNHSKRSTHVKRRIIVCSGTRGKEQFCHKHFYMTVFYCV